jgi:hypothetical protein
MSRLTVRPTSSMRALTRTIVSVLLTLAQIWCSANGVLIVGALRWKSWRWRVFCDVMLRFVISNV